MDTVHKQGQLLIDIASQEKIEDPSFNVQDLLSVTTHKHHKMAVYAAVMCDNLKIIERVVPVNSIFDNAAPQVQCCSLIPTNGNTLPDILRVDQRNSLTMTCVEYDACDCFKYLHEITKEDLNIIITKAIRYGAQKILTHLASSTDKTQYIITQARKSGLQLRICV
jgi:hypothetical protein